MILPSDPWFWPCTSSYEYHYEQYVGDALEAIGQAIFYQTEDVANLYRSTCEQAQETFLRSVSPSTGSELARYYEHYGARFQAELPVLWPVFLEDLRHGRV